MSASRVALARDYRAWQWLHQSSDSSHVMTDKLVGYLFLFVQEGDGFWSEIVKMDVATGSTQVWREEGTYPGEPIFVAGPAGSAEDDGVLLSVVLAGWYITTI